MTITLPTTTAHLAEGQHRHPLHHGSPPASSYWRIPHYLGGGLRTRRAQGPMMSRSSWVATLFRSSPLPPRFHPYSLSTTTRASPPLFSTSGNPVVFSLQPLHRRESGTDASPPVFPHPTSVVIATTTHRPFVWTYSMATPLGEHPHHTLPRRLRMHCSLQGVYIFLFLK